MTTKNLADNSSLVQAAIAEMEAIEARAAEVERLAEENEKKRQETESQRDAALRALEIASRRVRQQAKDNLAELEDEFEVIDEEAGQLAYILNGESDDEPVAPAPVSEPAPEPVVVPVAPAPEPPPVLFDDLADREPEPERTQAMSRINPRNWGWLSWVLAVLLAIIAYKIGDSLYHDYDNNVKQVFLWLAYKPAITVAGFLVGGTLGSYLQDYLERRRTTTAVA